MQIHELPEKLREKGGEVMFHGDSEEDLKAQPYG